MSKYCCCSSHLYMFVSEYLNSFIGELGLELIIIDKMDHIYSKKNIYFFVQSVPNFSFNGKNIFLLNIEQLSRVQYKKYIKNCLSYGIKVVDYSIENITYINKNNNILSLPYQLNELEISKLKEFVSVEKTYDIAFVGTISPKRKKILSELKNNGLNILEIHIFGDQRDKLIGSAKILLNIHFSDDYNMHETFRCDRFVFANMLVISESSIYNNLLDTSNLVIFVNYNNIVEKVMDVIDNYNNYYEQLISKNNLLFEHIKNNRFNNLLNLKNIFNNIISKNNPNNKIKKNILEIFSSDWQNNRIDDNFIKLNNNKIALQRGFNILAISGKKLFFIQIYDTHSNDHSQEIRDKLYNLYVKKKYDYIIVITCDDAYNSINVSLLESHLVFMGCKKLKDLLYRGRYFLLYDLKKEVIITEYNDNNYSIHEWYEIIKNNQGPNIIKNLGIPIYVIYQKNLEFTTNLIKKLQTYSKNIHIINNTHDTITTKYSDELGILSINNDTRFIFPLSEYHIKKYFPRMFGIIESNSPFTSTLPLHFLDSLAILTNELKNGIIYLIKNKKNIEKSVQVNTKQIRNLIFQFVNRSFSKDNNLIFYPEEFHKLN